MTASPTPIEADETRAALLARWLELTKVILPDMAAAQRWPIRLDHCFMRVCLDAAMGQPWHHTVRRPAVRHLPTPDLARAVAIAESIHAAPDRLRPLNNRSLEMRATARASHPLA